MNKYTEKDLSSLNQSALRQLCVENEIEYDIKDSKAVLREKLLAIETDSPLDQLDEVPAETPEEAPEEIPEETPEVPDETPEEEAPKVSLADIQAAIAARRASRIAAEDNAATEGSKSTNAVAAALAERRRRIAGASIKLTPEEAIAARRMGGNNSVAAAIAERRRKMSSGL